MSTRRQRPVRVALPVVERLEAKQLLSFDPISPITVAPPAFAAERVVTTAPIHFPAPAFGGLTRPHEPLIRPYSAAPPSSTTSIAMPFDAMSGSDDPGSDGSGGSGESGGDPGSGGGDPGSGNSGGYQSYTSESSGTSESGDSGDDGIGGTYSWD
ncbi:MAG: hypothetical protein ABI353_24025, partial [Isosphaeraceae bacterium]